MEGQGEQPRLPSRSVTLEYFASFREIRGCERETMETSAETAGELYRELSDRFPFPSRARIRVARNGRLTDWNAGLKNGDRIVFLAPFAGG